MGGRTWNSRYCSKNRTRHFRVHLRSRIIGRRVQAHGRLPTITRIACSSGGRSSLSISPDGFPRMEAEKFPIFHLGESLLYHAGSLQKSIPSEACLFAFRGCYRAAACLHVRKKSSRAEMSSERAFSFGPCTFVRWIC